MKRHRPRLFFPILLGILSAVIFVIAQNPPPADQSSVTILPTTLPTVTLAATQVPAPIAPAQVRANMSLPNAGVIAPIIDVYIRDGTWDVANLGAAVGHLQGTAPIGTPNNVGLAGHSELRDGARGIFAYIQELNYGDPILIEMGNARYEYRVSSLRHVDPADLSVLRQTDREILTLITCDDYDFLLNLYKTRVVVTAERVS
jgi:LPXTG-site transpeptidase (sortase) family protein